MADELTKRKPKPKHPLICGGESADQQTRFRQDLHLWWYHGCWSLHTGKCEKYIEHVCTRLFQLWSRSNKNNIKSSSFRSHGAPLNSDSRLYCRLLKMALLLLCFFFYLGHPRILNFYSTIPVDVVRVKSYIHCLFDPARVVIRVTINTLYFVPEWLVSGVMGMLWNEPRNLMQVYDHLDLSMTNNFFTILM